MTWFAWGCCYKTKSSFPLTKKKKEINIFWEINWLDSEQKEITWNISSKVEKVVIKYCARSSHQRRDWRHRHFWIDRTALEDFHKNKSKQNLQEEVATVSVTLKITKFLMKSTRWKFCGENSRKPDNVPSAYSELPRALAKLTEIKAAIKQFYTQINRARLNDINSKLESPAFIIVNPFFPSFSFFFFFKFKSAAAPYLFEILAKANLQG